MSAPLVFLHGWGLHSGIWTETLAALDHVEQQTLDLPGYGATPRTSPYDAQHLADSLAPSLPKDAIVIGWSMGGMVALALAAHHPVRALLLVGSTPVFRQRADWPHAVADTVLAGFADELARDYHATLLRFLALQARGGEAARHVISRLRASVFERGEPDPRTLADGLTLLRDVDLRGLAGQVQCPALILHGQHDTLCPVEAATWLAQQLVNGRLAVHPGAAHAPFLSHPDWFIAQVRGFLDEIGA